MKETRKSPTAVKAIACLLLLASLAMLFLPWLRLVVEAPYLGRLTVDDILELSGQTREEALDLLRTELLNETNENLAPTGSYYAVDGIVEIVRALLKGEYSLVDFAQVLTKGAKELDKMGALFDDPTGGELAGRIVKGVAFGLWGILGLMLVFGLLGLGGVFRDRRGWIFLYVLFSALLLTGVLLLRSLLNRILEAEAQNLLTSLDLGDILGTMNLDLRVVHMGIYAYLCPVLGLLAFVMMGIRRERTPAIAPKPGTNREPTVPAFPGREQGWICPKCGTACRAEEKFCQECGSPLPQASPDLGRLRCRSCGAVLPAPSAFCPNCGAALNHTPRPPYDPEIRQR